MESIVGNKVNNILLSICIPTYNRASVLDLCMSSIVTQKGFDYKTEIIILDNNSTDNTKEIVEKYSSKHFNILYFKNDVNIGMEKNILKVLEFGNGKLLKLLNDYSLICENALERIIDQIDNNQDERAILYFHNKITKKENLLCTDLNSFFREATYWPTWIGSFSVWKNDFENIKKTDIFEGLLFPHLLLFLYVFKLKSKIIIIHGKLFSDVVGIKKGGYNFFEVFIQNFIGTIIHGTYNKKEINFKTLYIVKSTFCSKFLSVWILKILFEKNSSFTTNKFNLVFKYFKFYPQLYFLFFKYTYNQLISLLKKFKKIFIMSKNEK